MFKYFLLLKFNYTTNFLGFVHDYMDHIYHNCDVDGGLMILYLFYYFIYNLCLHFIINIIFLNHEKYSISMIIMLIRQCRGSEVLLCIFRLWKK